MKRISQKTESGSLGKIPSKHVIYFIGLPGVGKPTVGKVITKRTGFILFDHNITYKEVCKFLPRGTQTAYRLNGKLHLAILALLLRSVVPGVVCTMSIRRHPTLETVSSAVRLIKKMGAKVSFVQIRCDWEEHKRRIHTPSRRELTKTNTIQKLKKHMSEPCFEGIKNHPLLVIDNTKLSAEKCAEKIISTFKLKRKTK
ncbi:MAG: AAA family ATPase [Patescibacteria group bacterium]